MTDTDWYFVVRTDPAGNARRVTDLLPLDMANQTRDRLAAGDQQHAEFTVHPAAQRED